MGWAKLEHGFFRNPKIIGQPAVVILLYLAAVCWSSEQLTDGYIAKSAAAALVGLVGANTRAIERLVQTGLWEPVDDGWQIHDYDQYQSTAEMVKARRQSTNVRVKRFRNGVTETVTQPVTNGVTNVGRNAT